MPGLFGGRHSYPVTTFKQDLARLIARNLEGRPGSERADVIAQTIIEKTYSFEYQVGGAYDPLVDQYGPYLISPIAFTLATKSWKIEHADGLSSIVYRQTPRHGFLVAKCIFQCFDYASWISIRNGFVQGCNTHNGYTGATYGSPESAGRVADNTRICAFWIGANGLTQFLKLHQQSSGSDFTSENAYMLKAARQELASFPDQGWGIFSTERNRCLSTVDDWLEQYGKFRTGR
jgi:hypothetical protein